MCCGVALGLAGKQMVVIILLKIFSSLKTIENDLVSFGASSLLVVVENGLWEEKCGWRKQKVAEGVIPMGRLK